MDAVKTGAAPGTVHALRGTAATEWMRCGSTTAHETNAGELLAAATLLGLAPAEIAIVGVEPEWLEMGMGLGEDGYGALRFGYLFSRDISNFTLGVGFRQGRWRLDYALGVGRADVASTHHVTVGARF